MAVDRYTPTLLCFLLLVVLGLSSAALAQTTDWSLKSAAHTKYDAGDLEGAKASFTELLDEFPTSSFAPDAQYFLGWIADKRNTGEAEALWQAVVDKYPQSPEAPKALMGIGAVHYKAKQPRPSRIADFEKVVALYPTSPEAEEAAFYVGSLSKGSPPDFDKALASFQYLVDNAKNPKWRAEAYVEIGLTYLQRYHNGGRKNADDLRKALDVLSSARTKYPDQADAVSRGELRLAKRYLYEEQNPAKARDALRSILDNSPDTTSTTDVLYQIAYCSFREKDYRTCIELCGKIIAERPVSDWNSYLQYFIGTCYLQMGDKADARAAFEKTGSTYPGTDWAKKAQANIRDLKL